MTGQRNDAVVSATPTPTDPATTDPATTDPNATPTPGATAGPVQLPENIAGQSAAQQTCSNGNGYSG